MAVPIHSEGMTGKRLRRERTRRGLSMRGLARKADVSVSTISHWEREMFVPAQDTIRKVVVALSGVPVLPKL